MKIKKAFEDKRWIPYTIAVCSGVLLYVILMRLKEIGLWFNNFTGLISPVIYGIVIAYLVSPLVSFLEKKVFTGIKREFVRHQLSNVTAMVTVVILFILLMSGLIPQLIESIKMFITNINVYASSVRDMLSYFTEQAEKHNMDMSVFNQSTTKLLNDIVGFITNNTGKIAESSLNMTNNAMNLGLGLILAVYFIVYKKTVMQTYHRLLKAFLSESRYNKTTAFLHECNQIMTTYVVSDILDGLIIAILNSIFMIITGMPYVVLISLVVGVTNLIPTFGPFIGAFIAGLILLFSSPQSVIPFLIFTLILQLNDGYVIKPKLFGGALGVPGIWITLGIIVGAKLFGFIGVLLSVPFVAIISFVIQDVVEKRERKNAAERELMANIAVNQRLQEMSDLADGNDITDDSNE